MSHRSIERRGTKHWRRADSLAAAAAISLIAAPGCAPAAPEESEPPAEEVGDTEEAWYDARSAVVDAAYWYIGTPYVWSWGWEPCDEWGADCECLNRLAYYWGAGIQLDYTLGGQWDSGWWTDYPQAGDLVFWDYDGDGWFGPYDHTGVYVGGGYTVHASAYWGYVVEAPVEYISAEAWGTYYLSIL